MAKTIPGRRELLVGNIVQAARFTATLAEINAGKTIVSGINGKQLVPVGFLTDTNGTFTTLTDVRLSDTASTPVDILTIAAAQLSDGDRHTVDSGTHTEGAGFLAALTVSKGIQIRKTGSDGAGGTDISGFVLYVVV